jgi:hypothetical protein
MSVSPRVRMLAAALLATLGSGCAISHTEPEQVVSRYVSAAATDGRQEKLF